jgi:hypothetical protein
LGGVTAIDTSIAGVTVKLVEPIILPEMAEILVMGTVVLSAVARPAGLILAVGSIDDVQVTDEVRFLVLESVYVPMAVNC